MPRILVAAGIVAASLVACTASATSGNPERIPSMSAPSTASRERSQARIFPPAVPMVPSSRLRLYPVATIGGTISPKSIDASGAGLFLAQNMMYRHTITVYDRDFRLMKTISDTVDLSRLGYRHRAGTVRGAPVEAAFSPDRRYAYVSNYSMYGPGFTHPGADACSPSQGIDASFVYRVDMGTLSIDGAIEVGSVPKYVAVSPDGRWVLVSNWCSYDLSVIDAARDRQVKRIALGPYPRGIAVDAASRTAYVAVMGSTSVAKVDLHSYSVSWIPVGGRGPRHVVMDPAGRYLYVTVNTTSSVVKIDLETDRVVGKAITGVEPRSMAISADGRSLYVDNYGSNTVSKVLTKTMRVVQSVATNLHPIGITYDPPTREVWVSCYSGTIMVFVDSVRP